MSNPLLKKENVFEEIFDGKIKFVKYKLRKHSYIGWVLEVDGQFYGKPFRLDKELSEEELEKMKHLMTEHAIGTYRDIKGFVAVDPNELDTTRKTEESTQ